MQLSLDGNVRDDFLVLVFAIIIFLLLVQDCEEIIQLGTAGSYVLQVTTAMIQ